MTITGPPRSQAPTRTKPSSTPTWLTVEETAKLLGLSPKTVLRAYRGEGPYRECPLPGYRASRKVLRFTLEDVNGWMLGFETPRESARDYQGTGRLRARRGA